MAELDRTRQQWERLGQEDPLWGVLSDDSKKGNRWDPEEFLATGRSEIDAALARLAALGVQGRGPALDVGCGAGRLTQALAARLGAAVGVDVSAGMIAKARALNRIGEACRFELISGADLSHFDDGSFGFVFSILALQHMPAPVAGNYLREFCRVLGAGGTMVFQIPTGRAPGWKPRRIRLDLALRRPWRRMDVNFVPEDQITRALREGGCRILQREADWRAGGGWRSATFTAQKG